MPVARFRAFDRLTALAPVPFHDRLGSDAGRFLYKCDLRHQIARETCLTGRYSPLETALVRGCLAAGDTFVDVGANFGYFALVAADCVGPVGRIIGIEPDPRAASEFRSNMELNGLRHVKVIEAAVTDAAAAVTSRAQLRGYSEDAGNWGISSLADSDRDIATGPIFDVRCATLDALLDEAAADRIALVKIDVEGAELRVLEGMRAGIGQGRYRRVLVEFHPWLHEDFTVRLAEVQAMMTSAGYRGALLGDTDARRALYGADVQPQLIPLETVGNAGAWPHVLWSLT